MSRLCRAQSREIFSALEFWTSAQQRALGCGQPFVRVFVCRGLVPVGVHRHHDRGMTEKLLDHLRLQALSAAIHWVDATQRMKPAVLELPFGIDQVSSAHSLPECARDVVRAGKPAPALIGGFPVDAGSSWVLGVEYLHCQFPADTITLADSLGSGDSFAINSKQSVDTVKGRISYLFAIH